MPGCGHRTSEPKCAGPRGCRRTCKLISESRARHEARLPVLVDISVDQGGCSETSRPTTHANPTYVLHEACTTA